jgi:Skp family chaperone for outer membrane proteins
MSVRHRVAAAAVAIGALGAAAPIAAASAQASPVNTSTAVVTDPGSLQNAINADYQAGVSAYQNSAEQLQADFQAQLQGIQSCLQGLARAAQNTQSDLQSGIQAAQNGSQAGIQDPLSALNGLQAGIQAPQAGCSAGIALLGTPTGTGIGSGG